MTPLYMSARNFLLMLLLSATVAYGMIEWWDGPGQWATLSELHARWNEFGQNKMLVSVQFQKRQACAKAPIVVKRLTRVVDNVEQSTAISLTGSLSEQMQEVAVGKSQTLFDRAVVERIPEPGQYVLTMVASCPIESGKPGQLLVSNTVKALVTVAPDPDP